MKLRTFPGSLEDLQITLLQILFYGAILTLFVLSCIYLIAPPPNL